MSGSNVLVYTDADFRAQFPFFADPAAYPEAQLSMFFTLGTEWVSDLATPGSVAPSTRQVFLYLMTAHLQALQTAIIANMGVAPNVETDATIDKVRVTVQPPIAKNQWQQWLGQTPWGQQLLSLLSLQAVGGFTIGGRTELAAFRRVGGCFG